MASSQTLLRPSPTPTAATFPPPPLPAGSRWARWWGDRRITLPTAAALAAASGVLAAALLPRGPTTRPEALALLTGVLLVGVAAGLLLRSRWSLLLAPVAHLAGFEVARATVLYVPGVVFGPIQLDTTAGITIAVIGHGLYALVTTMPMLAGAIWGAALARRLTPRPPQPPRSRAWRVVGALGVGLRLLLTGLLAAGVALLGFQFATAGKVTPVLGADGRVAAGSVAFQQRVRLGGVDQWVSIRGRSLDNPVLLYLSGGPGGSDLAYARYGQWLVDDFTVVVWEQRGTGMSYPTIDPSEALTVDRLVADGVELARWLQGNFDEEKIYLVGNSWGTTLGVLMVQRHPELFWAYVGTGQMVSQRATDRLLYQQALAYAQRTGNQTVVAKLHAWGPPPWEDPMTDALAHTTMGLFYEDLEPYPRSSELPPSALAARFFHGEYGLLDSWNSLRGLADMFSIVYPQLQGIDFRQTATRLDVPVYLMQGRHELSCRGPLAVDWFTRLQAPSKQLIWFERSGHTPHFEEAGRFQQVMVNTVLRETYPAATR
jgi:proline iminopeptidase